MHANSEACTRTTPYEQLGGATGVQQLVQAFYDQMDSSSGAKALRAMHAPDLGPMRHTLFEFLSGWLGGPRTYFERMNAKCMMSAHAGLRINRDNADQWLNCMRSALLQLDITEETRVFLDSAFTRVCNAMINC